LRYAYFVIKVYRQPSKTAFGEKKHDAETDGDFRRFVRAFDDGGSSGRASG
jgi:hypothetical protein